MSSVNLDEFLPTMQFGFNLNKDNEQVLHQLWITPAGQTEWRPVPMIELTDKRRPAIVGWLEEDD